MLRIEVAVFLHLPQEEQAQEECRKAIIAHLNANGSFKNIALLSKDPNNKSEAELLFCFEQSVSLNTLLLVITQSGARIRTQYLILPPSLSGVTNPYDARGYGVFVTAALKSVKGVIDATVSDNGMLHIHCHTHQPDMLLEEIITALTQIKKQ